MRTIPSLLAAVSALTGALLGATLVVAACGGSTQKSFPDLQPDEVEPPHPTVEDVDDVVPEPPAGPPASRREDVVDTLHGVQVADPYRWLEDAASPEVQTWMKAQDAYARGELAKLGGREELVTRLRELYYYDSLGAPSHRKGRYFWSRKHSDKEKTVIYWKQGDKGADRVLFDPNTWSDDGSSSLGGYWPSWDGTLVAYSVKENNADEATMYLFDVEGERKLDDVIPGAKYASASWTPDGKGFYYTWVPPVGGEVTTPNRPGFAEVRYHAVGTDPATDPIVHEKTGNPETFLGGTVSKDGKWLTASISHGWVSSDVYFRSTAGTSTDWKPLVTGVDATFYVTVHKDRFYVRTNHDAPRYRVFAVDPKKPARKHWKEIVKQDPEATMTGVSVVGGKLVVSYLRKASSELEIRTLAGKRVRKVALPGAGTTGAMVGLPDEDTGYFSYGSFTEPSVIFKTSIKSGKTDEWSRIELPIDPSQFVTEQVTYKSKDGTPITMFLLHRKDVVANGKNPTILYGYGGFNSSVTPSFSSARMVWLERGGVYALPNLRGGGEYGEDWHRDGMLLHKQNVFDDYIAAAHWLIDNQWTSTPHLAIEGRSNGGLLTGAAVTQAPELFGAVICGVPLLDMVRYHLSGSGKTWVPEYGSADDATQFAALHAYSPYHHVQEGVAYPPLLMLSADSDDRVDPNHARKMTAALQAASSSKAPVLLRIEQNSGHGGGDLVWKQIEQTADTYVFLFEHLQM